MVMRPQRSEKQPMFAIGGYNSCGAEIRVMH